ncbi:hypothetical protein VOI32_36840 [Paraburkholderia caribensis]|uniref:Reverse transcriptase domain-containing protein n=1 Tax=Paraburkholderia caribensis TaxID=75105 RepID=A0ABV0E7P7_9BURK|nr:MULTISPECIES: hypothetical protein [Paraburkholderia]MCO4882000.1 hypothetical protein [Paraburkholderia caribensis]
MRNANPAFRSARSRFRNDRSRCRNRRSPSRNGRSRSSEIRTDDFIVTGVSKEVLECKVLPAVRRFMAARGLELSEEKTRITNIAEGFDFLGQNVHKYDGKLLIKPAKKSVKSLLDKVREIIKGNASVTQEALIQKLNRSSGDGRCITITSWRKRASHR